jgi:hypothetical protein
MHAQKYFYPISPTANISHRYLGKLVTQKLMDTEIMNQVKSRQRVSDHGEVFTAETWNQCAPFRLSPNPTWHSLRANGIVGHRYGIINQPQRLQQRLNERRGI